MTRIHPGPRGTRLVVRSDTGVSIELQGDPETILWTLAKDVHTVTAAVRGHPQGRTLIVRMDGALLWSQTFTDGDGAILGTLADEKRHDFLERGWTDGQG